MYTTLEFDAMEISYPWPTCNLNLFRISLCVRNSWFRSQFIDQTLKKDIKICRVMTPPHYCGWCVFQLLPSSVSNLVTSNMWGQLGRRRSEVEKGQSRARANKRCHLDATLLLAQFKDWHNITYIIYTGIMWQPICALNWTRKVDYHKFEFLCKAAWLNWHKKCLLP